VNAASIPIKEKPDAAGAGASEIMKELFGNYKGDSKESVAGEIDRW
jgi:alpha-D-ribose 1-methylphosphonate 5-triphosphate synthase subunit PhnL